MRDKVCIEQLELRTTCLEEDHWHRLGNSQPLVVDLEILSDLREEAAIDDLRGDSAHYGNIVRALEHVTSELNLEAQVHSLQEMAEAFSQRILFGLKAPNVRLVLTRPRAWLAAEGVALEVYRERGDYEGPHLRPSSRSAASDTLRILNLRRQVIVGLNPPERQEPQDLLCDLTFYASSSDHKHPEWDNWRRITKSLEASLESEQAGTLESLTTVLARRILKPAESWNVLKTTVTLKKPVAVMFARYPTVTVTRVRSDFASLGAGNRSVGGAPTGAQGPTQARGISTAAGDEGVEGTQVAFDSFSTIPSPCHRAVLALGGNMGNVVQNMTQAVKLLESNYSAKVVDSSFLYESEPMYVEEQSKFLNGAVMITTHLPPTALLSAVKDIENTVGRKPTIRNGPRAIDIDILFYDDAEFTHATESDDPTRWLQIPHPRLPEREFALRPVCDFDAEIVHPTLKQTCRSMLESLMEAHPSSLRRIQPLSFSRLHPLSHSLMRPVPRAVHRVDPSQTMMMSILNVTPDSFSDGGDNFHLDRALETARMHIQAGVQILDIGGFSTRPGAPDISEEEELRRVIPVISAIRDHYPHIPISIDTFRPEVARQAVIAGATIINDVRGGLEDGMAETTKELGVPIIIMHSRGTHQNMASRALTNYDDYQDGVVGGVRAELGAMVRRFLDIGVLKWNIILDPGIGFAKTMDDNVVLLRDLSRVLGRDTSSPHWLAGYPVLVALSRKKFLGKLMDRAEGDNPKDRVYATAAAVAISVAHGADMVRVHDVDAMMDVIRVADAIYER